MASLWKHPKSQFWYACYTDHTGKQRKRSTKLTDRSDALNLAVKWEKAYRRVRSETQARRVSHSAVGGWILSYLVARHCCWLAYLSWPSERKMPHNNALQQTLFPLRAKAHCVRPSGLLLKASVRSFSKTTHPKKK